VMSRYGQISENPLTELQRRVKELEDRAQRTENSNGVTDFQKQNNTRSTVKDLKEMNDRLTRLTGKHYHVLYHDSMAEFIKTLKHPNLHFHTEPIQWKRFLDGTDKIEIDELKTSSLTNKHIFFVANFESNDATLSQLHALTYLCEVRIQSLTLLMPFFPTGTAERVSDGEEQIVPTANTLALMLSGLPRVGPPVRIMTYDIHALQEQFYFGNNAVADLRSAIPALLKRIETMPQEKRITCIAFPDDGAKKRFSKKFPGFTLITCGKERKGQEVKVIIQEITRTEKGTTSQINDISGQHVLIVDDQTKSGSTTFQCIRAVFERSPASVSAYVTHGAFIDRTKKNSRLGTANDFLENFTAFLNTNSNAARFGKFYITNSVPVLDHIKNFKQLGTNKECFEIIDLAPQVIEDLLSDDPLNA
jgi:phosphoribosylpyrophosphate synthetase